MYQNFTSLSPNEEQAFVVYEQTMQEKSKKATRFGVIAGAVFFVIVLIIFLSGEKPKSRFAEGSEESSEMGSEERAAPAPTPEPAKTEEAAPAAAPEGSAEGAEGGAAEGGAAEGGAAEGGAAEAPAPPPGATKAPPTALTK